MGQSENKLELLSELIHHGYLKNIRYANDIDLT